MRAAVVVIGFEVSLVWFQVPVDNAIVMEILQSQDCLCKVHPGHIHRQGTHVLQKGGTVSTCTHTSTDVFRVIHTSHCSKVYCFQSQLLTFHIFHDHAQVASCLKGAVHGHHKRVLGEGEDVPLHKGLMYLVSQNQVLLIDLFHGKSLLGLLVPHQINSTVG